MEQVKKQKAEDEDFIKFKVDMAFKFVMKNKMVLRNFLASVLSVPEEEITDIEFRNTVTEKEDELGKTGIMDVRVSFSNGKHMNTEIQLHYFEYWKERVMFYLFRMYTEQRGIDKHYNGFQECIHISILDFNLFEGDKYYSKIMLMDTENFTVFTDKVTFHMIELNKLKNVREEDKDDLFYWSSLINANSWEEYEMLAKKNEYLQDAVDEIKKIKRDYALKEEYLKREMALMDEASQRESYREMGLREGKKLGQQIETQNMSLLYEKLAADGRIAEFGDALKDMSLKRALYKEYGIEEE